MMVDVTPRRWDVARLAALLAMASLVASACGQAQVTSPPTPEFTRGSQAVPTALDAEVGGGEGDLILPSDVEADVEPVDGRFDVARMLLVDDAGNTTPDAARWAEFDEALQRRLGGNQAVGVAVMIGGRVVHEGAFGQRVPGGDPVDTGDRFRVASISKTITAIVAMQLVDDGVLGLDDPVGDVVAGHLGVADPDPDVSSITLRELLSHTAGFPKHENTFFGAGATSCTDAAVQGLSSGVSASGAYRYSNMSYCVLGVLIEAVTGKTYERVVHERLLGPLGIEGMRLTGTYEVGPDEVAHAVTPGRNFMETLAAAGSWNATPADLVTILNSIDHDTPGWKAVSADAARAMRFRIDTGQLPGGYGLGLINYENDSWGHTGTIQNTHAMVLRQSDGITWAITVAGNSPSDSGRLRSLLRSSLSEAFG
jgi:D-alanyl-D-alanine carboxypeptidase